MKDHPVFYTILGMCLATAMLATGFKAGVATGQSYQPRDRIISADAGSIDIIDMISDAAKKITDLPPTEK